MNTGNNLDWNLRTAERITKSEAVRKQREVNCEAEVAKLPFTTPPFIVSRSWGDNRSASRNDVCRKKTGPS